MRVVAGSLRGKQLNTLEGLDVRPTTDRVKEALFSALQFDLPGACFLDLYAGSGQNGIEAMSRGAKKVVFVDQNRKAIDIINDNLKAVGLQEEVKVCFTTAEKFLEQTLELFDIAFLDPPYHKGLLPEILPFLAKKMAKNSIIVCEHEKNEEIPKSFCGFHLKKQYQYGKLCLSKYEKRQDGEDTDENCSMSG